MGVIHICNISKWTRWEPIPLIPIFAGERENNTTFATCQLRLFAKFPRQHAGSEVFSKACRREKRYVNCVV